MIPGEVTEPIIELAGYSFTYRAQAQPTLRDIDLRIVRGEKVAIVGPSGSGKSTLLRAIDGLIPHQESGIATGTVRVAGRAPSRDPLVRTARTVGTVLQDMSSQFVGLTVAEDIAFSLENQEVPTADMPDRVQRAAARVGMEHLLDVAPQELSGGQKQRVAVAGVLVDDVDVLLFDEPLAMLDPAAGRDAVELIDDLHAAGTTVVIVEHRLEEVLHRPVDRIVVMSEGRIVADAPPDEIVASGILERLGIRPPLHVAALAFAGTPVTADQHPADVSQVELTSQQTDALRAWVQADPGPDPAHGFTAPPSTPAFATEDVVVRLPGGTQTERTILDRVSTRVERGEILGVVGSNGAGKSSLARVVCGFLPTTAGTVRIDGQDAGGWGIAQRGEHIGFVLQEPSQMLSRPLVTEELALGLRSRGVPEAEQTARIDEALTVCGLRPVRSWPISALSHGQKKRLTIAAVLVMRPEVLILDEPTAGQDLAHYSEFMDHLARIHSGGTTIVLITHDMHLALEYTDRVLVMSQGRILADAHPADVLTDVDLTARADLVTTGLYTLAARAGIEDPARIVRRFVAADRARRAEDRP